TVKFIENHPELLHLERRLDRANKILHYLADVTVNGNPDVKVIDPHIKFRYPAVPSFNRFDPYPEGTKNKLTNLGRDKFIDWLKKEKSIQYTDTTLRDAHQSLLATRVRTIDMMKVAESFARNHPQVFSMEVWGGATFDVALRFLHECPWQRLQLFREAMPNLLLQMLLRGSNAVGYTAYPDNLVEKFIEKAWENGIDIFRIFDSLNWVEAMKVSIKTVRERTDAIAEACICYTGDILDENKKKYTLKYYLDLAKRLEDQGAHILAIKDMAGLLKPYSAEVLITELKRSIDIPIHLHTHDTSSIQSATYLKAIEAGVDVVDLALGSISGLTSQPNFNSVAAMMKGHERELDLDHETLNQFSNYWEDVREYYYPFESGLKAGTAEVFDHEIPGGQYSNLRPQAQALGLGNKFVEIKKNYKVVNDLFGDVIKVTPSSKVVGDLALYMTSNNLTAEDILERGEQVSFPESVKSYFKGDLGQPYKGFPKKLQAIVLKGEKPFKNRPNAHLQPIDFDLEFEEFKKKFDKHRSFLDFLSYKLYPKVFEDYYNFQTEFGDVMPVPSPPFFFGMKHNEELLIEIASGKNLLIQLVNAGDTDENGMRTVYFKLNGQTRGIEVRDRSFKVEKEVHKKAEAENEIGAPLQGKLTKILVKAGITIKKNEPLFVIEAMKMESTITSSEKGKVKRVHLKEGTMVEQDDLIIELA
ncbi:MAG: pyruvate carboxylase subunit B, partial [Bacteroidia bacterium]|nr:pyruvate carboxylase subunit B [Bacteroidia bacterium]